MSRVHWSSLRAAADAVIKDTVDSQAALAAGRRGMARFHRWRAARRSLHIEICARQHRGLDVGDQKKRYGQIQLEDFAP